MSRFVVTGAGGFIGRRLCADLRRRGRVTAIVRRAGESGPWDECVVADITRDDIPAGPFDGADAVFHLAGRAHTIAERADDTAMYTRVNVDGTRRIVAAARAGGVSRLVFASSVKAMGEDGDTGGPTSAYGISKREAERTVLDSGIAATVLRLSLVYGPGVGGNLGGMLRAIRAGRFPPPPRVGNRRSMVHVDDVVRVAVAAAGEGGGRTLVIGDGVPYSTRGIYEAMCRALGRPVPAWSLPAVCWRSLALAGDALGALMRRRAPFDSAAYHKLFGSAWYEPSDVQTVLGVPPFHTLDEALAEMVRTP